MNLQTIPTERGPFKNSTWRAINQKKGHKSIVKVCFSCQLFIVRTCNLFESSFAFKKFEYVKENAFSLKETWRETV